MTKTTPETVPKQWLNEPRPLAWPSEIGTPRGATGTDNLAAANWLVKQTRAIAWPAWEPEIQMQPADDPAAIAAALAMLKEIGPRDMVQGMLAAQMVAVHFAVMGSMCLLKRTNGAPAAREFDIPLAVKLLNTFSQQIWALNDCRRGGMGKKAARPAQHKAGAASDLRPRNDNVV